MKNIIIFLLIVISNQLYSQKIQVYNVHNSDESTKLQWYEIDKNIQAKRFKIFRTSLKDNAFDSIQTIHYATERKLDTIVYTVLDTTLTKRAIYKYYISREGNKREIMNSEIAFGHNLGIIPNPRVTSFEVNSSKVKKAIELNWKLNHSFSVRSLSIFRSSHYEKDFVKIAELDGDETSYADNVPLSNHDYFYFILIADYFGYQNPSAPTPGFCSFKQKPYAPQNLKLKKSGNKVELSWENLRNNLSGFKVYRALGNEDFVALHVMQTSNKLKENFTDVLAKDIESTNLLRYYVVNFGDSYLLSNPSDTLRVLMKRKLTLDPPEEFDALKQDNNQIKFIWTRSKSNDVVGYNVYATYPEIKKLNKTIIPKHINFFTDSTNYKSGQYRFEIESVGKNNSVSEFKMKTSATILSPYYHLVVDTKKSLATFELQWMALDTKMIKTVSLYRQEEELNPVLLKSFKNVNTVFKDNNLTKGKTYFYSFFAELTTGEKVVINDRISLHY